MNRLSVAVVLVWLSVAAGVHGQEVTKVINGETIEVQGVGRVRLVGIDADMKAVRFGPAGPPAPPRSDPSDGPPPPLVTGRIGVRGGGAASDALQRLVLGKRVRLEYDGAANKGRGGPRAYVYLEDGSLVNEEMLRDGYARVDSSRPFGRMKQFQALEAEAREASRGIWAERVR